MELSLQPSLIHLESGEVLLWGYLPWCFLSHSTLARILLNGELQKWCRPDPEWSRAHPWGSGAVSSSLCLVFPVCKMGLTMEPASSVLLDEACRALNKVPGTYRVGVRSVLSICPLTGVIVRMRIPFRGAQVTGWLRLVFEETSEASSRVHRSPSAEASPFSLLMVTHGSSSLCLLCRSRARYPIPLVRIVPIRP